MDKRNGILAAEHLATPAPTYGPAVPRLGEARIVPTPDTKPEQSKPSESLEKVKGLTTAIQSATTETTPTVIAGAENLVKEWSDKERLVYYFLEHDMHLDDKSDLNSKLDALSYQYYKYRYQATSKNQKANFEPWKSPQDLLSLEDYKKTTEYKSTKLALLMFTNQQTKKFNGKDPISERLDQNGQVKTIFEHFKDPNCDHSKSACQGKDHLEKYFGLVVPKDASGIPEDANGKGYYALNSQTGEPTPLLYK